MVMAILILVGLFLSKKYPFNTDEDSQTDDLKGISGQYGNDIGSSCPTRFGAGTWCEYSMICGKSYYQKGNSNVKRKLKPNGDVVDERGTKHGNLQIVGGTRVHFVHHQSTGKCLGNMILGGATYSYSTNAGRSGYEAQPRLVFGPGNVWCECYGDINNCRTRYNC